MLKKLYHYFMNDPLYQNSIFIMASTLVLAVSGFIFWIFVAHIFPVESIGIATALISLMTLICNFTHVGLNVALIKYLPKSKSRNDVINSASILVIITTTVVTGIFLFILKVLSPQLIFITSNLFYIISFIFFMIAASLNIILESIFTAYRKAINILIKNIALSILKLLLPLFLVSLGAYGIFASVSLATVISVAISFAILIYRFHYRPFFTFNIKAVKEMAFFSGANYLAGFLSQAPMLLLPLFIVNFLYAKAAAYYYIDTMILNLLVIIPLATTNALLAEGSYDADSLKGHLKKAIKIISFILVPSILIIFFFGNIILHFFGKNYETEAFQFLQIISLSAIFISVTYLGSAILKIKDQVYTLIFMNFLGAVLILGCSCLFISHGLVGVGWGWLLGQALSTVPYLILFGRKFIKR